jgi:beta-N-acetylhexosaminidase
MPTTSKYAGTTCYGVQVHITDADAFRPIETWLSVIMAIRQLYPKGFDWLPLTQAQVDRSAVQHFDRLIGSDQPRNLIEAEASLSQIIAEWPEFSDEFRTQRAPYLLYE